MQLNYQLFEAGFCTHCARMTRTSGALKKEQYPALCTLIQHPQQGYILFDTGYSERFYALTQQFPFSLYRYLTPVTVTHSLKDQLAAQGIVAQDIRYIVISHFHADHIGGLHDFPQAQFICHQDAVDAIKSKKGLSALIKGFLPGLLPHDFFERVTLLRNNEKPLDNHLFPFTKGFDLFADNSLFAILLPGHAPGQIGLYFKAARDTFLIADSCWHQETFQDLIYPSKLTHLIHDNVQDYKNTINKLHQLYQRNKEIDLIPAHCSRVRESLHGAFL